MPLDEALEMWQQLAVEKGLPRVERMTKQRKQKLSARLREVGLEGWEKALAAIRSSKFHCGENDRGWRASFDFVDPERNEVAEVDRTRNGKRTRSTNPRTARRHDAARSHPHDEGALMENLILVTNPGAKTTILKIFNDANVVVVNDGSDLYEQTRDGEWTLKPDVLGFGQYTFAFERGFERLRDQLAISLGDENCWWVDLETDPWNYPTDQLANLINKAKRMWSDEIFTFGDLPPEQPQEAFTTGFRLLDEHGFRLVRSAFMPVIGPYGSGKSVLLRQLAVNMWKLHGWRSPLHDIRGKAQPL